MTLGPLTLLRPEALGWLALAVPLVLLHLRRVRRRRVDVSSVRLWAELPGRGAPRPGLRMPAERVALLLSLLATAAFAVALARPVTGAPPAPGRSVVLIVDASATMSVVEAGGTRFDAARSAAADVVGRLGARDDVTVWAGADGPVALVSPTRDHDAAQSRLATLRPTLAPRSLARTIAAAQRALELRETVAPVLVLTDAPGAASLGRRDDVTILRAGRAEVTNAAITDVAVGPGPSVSVRVEQVEGAATVPRRVELTSVDGVDVLAAADVMWAAGRDERVLLLPGAARGVLGVRLVPGDAFPDDDVTAVHVPAAPPLRVAVITRDGRASPFVRAVLDALADAVDAAGSVVATPDVGAEVLATVDVVLADGSLPDALPSGLPVLAFVEEGERVDRPLLWGAAEHPVLDGVDLSPLRIDHAAVRAPGPGERVLVETASGPVGVTHEGAARRRVTLRFRPEASTLPVEPAFPLLVRNAFEWLVARPVPPAIVRAGAPVPLPDTERRPGATLRLALGDVAHRASAGPDGAEPLAPVPAPGASRVLRVARDDGAVIAATGLLWNLSPGERLGVDGVPPGRPLDALDASLSRLLPARPKAHPRREHAAAFALAAAVLLVLGALAVGPGRRSV